MIKINKGLTLSVLSVALVVSTTTALNIKAATTDGVAATVTAQNISVAVTDGVVAYGTLAVSTSANTALAGLNDSQTATNDGNITEDFNVQGSNSGAWTLAGTIGSETYVHEWCTVDCDGTPTWNALTTGYQTLATGVAALGTQLFDLKLSTPSSTATFTEQTVDVTVQAVQT